MAGVSIASFSAFLSFGIVKRWLIDLTTGNRGLRRVRRVDHHMRHRLERVELDDVAFIDAVNLLGRHRTR